MVAIYYFPPLDTVLCNYTWRCPTAVKPQYTRTATGTVPYLSTVTILHQASSHTFFCYRALDTILYL
jgi:hypothetical protein